MRTRDLPPWRNLPDYDRRDIQGPCCSERGWDPGWTHGRSSEEIIFDISGQSPFSISPKIFWKNSIIRREFSHIVCDRNRYLWHKNRPQTFYNGVLLPFTPLLFAPSVFFWLFHCFTWIVFCTIRLNMFTFCQAQPWTWSYANQFKLKLSFGFYPTRSCQGTSRE